MPLLEISSRGIVIDQEHSMVMVRTARKAETKAREDERKEQKRQQERQEN